MPEQLERLIRVEAQVARLVSDAESEKDTRRRANLEVYERFEKFEDRLRRMEQTIWISSGAVAILMIAVNLYVALR